MARVYDAFGPVPAHVAPSTPVRRWDQAILAALGAFGLLWAGGLALGLLLPGPWLGSYVHHLIGAPQTLLHYLTVGITHREQARAYLVSLSPMEASALLRVGVPLLLASVVAAWVFARGLKPTSNTWHLSGPRLLEGKEALVEARLRTLTPDQMKADPWHLAIHPALTFSKKRWSRHALFYGSPGSGKTVILLPIISQLIERDAKALIYDSKGDFTSYFKKPIIVSPFDRRSWVWDIGRDVRTPTQAAAFASSIIPDDPGPGRFWSIAAQLLLTGAQRSLQNTKGIDWGWKDLADKLAQGAEAMGAVLEEHYPKALPVVSNTEGQSTASALMTLAGYTKIIDDLATAWPERTDRSFSITAWARDDYAGRKQVIVQAGNDPQLTRAYIAAMINVCVPTIISPALPDDEEGRCLAFILDELPSIGRIALPPLLDKGRSKGAMVLMGLQDLSQLREIYGQDQTNTIESMVATKVICQVQPGESRDKVASVLGKQKVGWQSHGDNATVHEESRSVVSPDRLTSDLGFRKHKKMGPEGWGIRAIVSGEGGDPLLLDFPGVSYPKVRRGQVAAGWTTRPAGGDPRPEPVAPVVPAPPPNDEGGLSLEAVRDAIERIYGNE